jgi:hypothetical protein
MPHKLDAEDLARFEQRRRRSRASRRHRRARSTVPGWERVDLERGQRRGRDSGRPGYLLHQKTSRPLIARNRLPPSHSTETQPTHATRLERGGEFLVRRPSDVTPALARKRAG